MADANEGKNMLERIKFWNRDEEGATAVEYGIMVALIAVVIIVAVVALGDNLSTLFQDTADCIADPTADGCEEID